MCPWSSSLCVTFLDFLIFSERYLPVPGSADWEHFDSLGSRTDMLGCSSVSDAGVSTGPLFLERVLHGLLVRQVRLMLTDNAVFTETCIELYTFKFRWLYSSLLRLEGMGDTRYLDHVLLSTLHYKLAKENQTSPALDSPDSGVYLPLMNLYFLFACVVLSTLICHSKSLLLLLRLWKLWTS